MKDRKESQKGMGMIIGPGAGAGVGITLMIAWGYFGLILGVGLGFSVGLMYESAFAASPKLGKIMAISGAVILITLLLVFFYLVWTGYIVL